MIRNERGPHLPVSGLLIALFTFIALSPPEAAAGAPPDFGASPNEGAATDAAAAVSTWLPIMSPLPPCLLSLPPPRLPQLFSVTTPPRGRFAPPETTAVAELPMVVVCASGALPLSLGFPVWQGAGLACGRCGQLAGKEGIGEVELGWCGEVR